MVGFLEIAIFLFATSIHNGQALAHWARAIASLTRRVHCWIEFWDWIGFIWQTVLSIYIYIYSNIFAPAFCLFCHVLFCKCKIKTKCNNNQYYMNTTAVFCCCMFIIEIFHSHTQRQIIGMSYVRFIWSHQWCVALVFLNAFQHVLICKTHFSVLSLTKFTNSSTPAFLTWLWSHIVHLNQASNSP